MRLAVGAGVGAYFQTALHNLSAVRQVKALRSAYIRALFRQDIAWCDAHSAGEECARLTEDTLAVEDGIGSKLPLITQSMSTFFAGLSCPLPYNGKCPWYSWGSYLSLGGVMALISSSVLGSDDKSADAYGGAGEVATEALHNIRTVAAFGGKPS
jgi:ATP-binding cassette subfamily B (MDR/TAP) protein 1